MAYALMIGASGLNERGNGRRHNPGMPGDLREGVAISVEVDAEANERVGEGLRASNALRSPALVAYYAEGAIDEPLQVFARDETGEIIGGVTGATSNALHWAHIDRLWVAESHRGYGLGTELMLAAEQEARRRGCGHIHLTTMDFQAPGFYAALGYTEFGRLEESLPGATEFFLRKRL